MDLDFKPTTLEDPKLKEMIWAYYDAFHIDRKTFHPPTQWVGASEGSDLLAAIGFTRTPDSAIVFVAELVCEQSGRGRRALTRLVDRFQHYCVEHPDIQLVLAQCLTSNEAMHKFLSNHTFMRPISTTFACKKSDLAVEETDNGRRWITRV